MADLISSLAETQTQPHGRLSIPDVLTVSTIGITSPLSARIAASPSLRFANRPRRQCLCRARGGSLNSDINAWPPHVPRCACGATKA